MASSDSIPWVLAIVLLLPTLLGLLWPYPARQDDRRDRRLVFSTIGFAVAIFGFCLWDLLQGRGPCQIEGATYVPPEWWMIINSGTCEEQNAISMASWSLICVPLMVVIDLAASRVRRLRPTVARPTSH